MFPLKKNKKIKLLLLSALTGLLLAFAWPSFGFAPLLLIAFVPLLMVEDHITHFQKQYSRFAVFKYSFLAFFIWNIICSYWICYATLFGIVAPILNAFLQALVFQLYHIAKKNLFNNRGGFIVLISLWISMEYIHYNWELSWPWMSLGNGFAKRPLSIQWYEYTGVFGGSLWVWITNYFFYKALVGKPIRNSIFFILSVLLPIVFSLVIYNNYEDEDNPALDVVVLQPNLEPYIDSLQLSNNQITDLIIDMARKKTDDNTSFILAPEGSLEENVWEDQLKENKNLVKLSQFVGEYKNAVLIAGLFSKKLQDETEKDEASRPVKYAPKPYYSVYNSAISIGENNSFVFYHKTKLVPGVERLPFKKYIGFILDFAIKLGNLPVGTLAIDNKQPLYYSKDSLTRVVTPICYESVYGQYVANKVREGAQLIFIITNDSWWKDSQGHKQHALYAALRAIETRRYIARSANTGTSCFFNAKGEMSQQTKFFTPAVIKSKLVPQNRITFYVKYGDYIARIFSFMAIIVIIAMIMEKIFRTIKKKNQ
ncbi:MAG: apolipoprotein N-acyltransferase [Bacteroidales bacterium]|jgi:apolipoprotein N-acyltransferase|nr:apolipoprotein N-acyltransferase [Bacteroidales bacterium]